MSLRAKLLMPVLLLTAGLSLAACAQPVGVGGTATISAVAANSSTVSIDAQPSSVAAAARPAAPNSAAAGASAPVVALASAGTLGQVLVDSKGLTLYAFTNDTDGKSTCFDACAAAWPALTVPAGFNVANTLDAKLFGLAARPDGSQQLTAKGHPLYYYAGDGAPKDTNGQGVGGKWFTVSAAGALIGKEVASGAAPAGGAAAGAAVAPQAATPSPAAPSPAAPSSAAAPASAPVVALASAGALGQVLVDSKGLTLYAFTNDTDGKSTCFDACAAAWPALTVPAGFNVANTLDAKLFGLAARPDGSQQLTAKGHPLYYYAGDGAPKDTNGQGVGSKWFTVSAAGALIGKEVASGAAPAGVAAAATTAPTAPKSSAAPSGPVVDLAQVGNLGEVMVGANGHTLYAFTNDHDGQSTCFDACAKAWPPLTVSPDFKLSAELNANGVSLFTRPDGSKQLVMGNWPVYYYAGDAAPGDANGQGIGGKWYAVNRHCKLVKEPVS